MLVDIPSTDVKREDAFIVTGGSTTHMSLAGVQTVEASPTELALESFAAGCIHSLLMSLNKQLGLFCLLPIHLNSSHLPQMKRIILHQQLSNISP